MMDLSESLKIKPVIADKVNLAMLQDAQQVPQNSLPTGQEESSQVRGNEVRLPVYGISGEGRVVLVP